MICIEREVFEEKELTPAAKLFYGWLKNEIKYLSENNQFYADKFNVSTMTINNWLFALEKHKLIRINYYKKERTIYLLN
jgi:hypothetical protein